LILQQFQDMKFRDLFYARLQSLPDRATQQFPPDIFPENYRTAAVLLAFWPEPDGSVSLVLTRRTDNVRHHQGQVSFPGGSMHAGDDTVARTALREAEEELAILPHQVRIMGRLDDAWSRFGFHVIPVVGWLEQRPEMKPDPDEVAEIIIADVQTLMRPESACMHRIADRESQAFRWDGGYVWGLTAEILLELFMWVRGEASNRRDFRLAWLLKQRERQ
jgi:8-oxo-dGTP pyrophosphatase MutT (NUDIX family)